MIKKLDAKLTRKMGNYEFIEIDGWLWVKLDDDHMERLPKETYTLYGKDITIKGSFSRWVRERLKEKGVID